jgi:secondary thiamine-phosphate synthase enzyme
MRQAATILEVRTRGKGLYEFTSQVIEWVRAQKVETGLLTLFCRHTSASLVIQENADPDVQTDLGRAFDRLAPEDQRLYIHTIEGADDMPAHIRSVLAGVHLSIPIVHGAPTLGTWQGIYLFEHRGVPHRRSIALHLLGE